MEAGRGDNEKGLILELSKRKGRSGNQGNLNTWRGVRVNRRDQ